MEAINTNATDKKTHYINISYIDTEDGFSVYAVYPSGKDIGEGWSLPFINYNGFFKDEDSIQEWLDYCKEEGYTIAIDFDARVV